MLKVKSIHTMNGLVRYRFIEIKLNIASRCILNYCLNNNNYFYLKRISPAIKSLRKSASMHNVCVTFLVMISINECQKIDMDHTSYNSTTNMFSNYLPFIIIW